MKKQLIQDFTAPHLELTMNTILEQNWGDQMLYGDFLSQTYFHICHSTRLLAAAGARFDVSRDDLHLRCMQHAAEERSHEKLSVSDLRVLGMKIGDFPELPATKALYRTAYYLIEHVSPVSLLGYAYFLECIGVAGGRLAEKLEPIYGKQAVKHVSLHAKEDPGHIQAYEGSLNAFSGEDRAAIEESIVTTAYHYELIYREVAARARARGSKLKAA
jgi:hypothetical protein